MEYWGINFIGEFSACRSYNLSEGRNDAYEQRVEIREIFVGACGVMSGWEKVTLIAVSWAAIVLTWYIVIDIRMSRRRRESDLFFEKYNDDPPRGVLISDHHIGVREAREIELEWKRMVEGKEKEG